MLSTVADPGRSVDSSAKLFGRTEQSKRNRHMQYLFRDCGWRCQEIADLMGVSKRQVERVVQPARQSASAVLTEQDLSPNELARMAVDYSRDPYISAEDREEGLLFVNLMLDRMSHRPKVDGPISA